MSVGSVVLGVGGVLASSVVKSPAEAAAEREAPAASVLSAMVEERVLADTVVTRGLVGAAAEFEIVPSLSVEGRAVVTAVRAPAGAELQAGDVVVEVSGRPVVVLPGPVPAYRDLLPGASGDDVAQLQAALTALGFVAGDDEDGVFGPGTQQAVEGLYGSIGYPLRMAGEAEAVRAAGDAVRAAERAVSSAEKEVLLAIERANSLKQAAAAADVAAEKAKQAAEKAIAEAQADPEDELLQRASEEAQQASVIATDDAVVAAEAAQRQPGERDPVEVARELASQAREDLNAAREMRTEVVSTSGAMVPLGEVVFVPAIPARVQSLQVSVGDEVAGPVATVSAGELVVTASVNRDVAGLLAEGMVAHVLSEVTGLEAGAVITEVGQPGEGGIEIVVTPDTPLPADSAGADVRVTVTAAQTDGPVLVVPLSAISATADGSTIVVVVGPDGEQSRVPVRAGVSGDGFVEVDPLTVGALQDGDRVVVGADVGVGS